MNFKAPIVGTKFREAEVVKLLDGAPKGVDMQLVLEPDNKFDQHAVKVMYVGEHVGYVPKTISNTVGTFIKEGRVLEVKYNGDKTVNLLLVDKGVQPDTGPGGSHFREHDVPPASVGEPGDDMLPDDDGDDASAGDDPED
jgi:hypothetical protein